MEGRSGWSRTSSGGARYILRSIKNTDLTTKKCKPYHTLSHIIFENMQQIHILLVDDNEGDILLTREALEEARIINKISIAYDGVEAISFLQSCLISGAEFMPDLILLDINLPKMDGT